MILNNQNQKLKLVIIKILVLIVYDQNMKFGFLKK